MRAEHAALPPVALPLDAHALIHARRLADLEDWPGGRHLESTPGAAAIATAGRAYIDAPGASAPEPAGWPWPQRAWEPGTRLENLTRGGALLLAAAEHVDWRDGDSSQQSATRAALFAEVENVIVALDDALGELTANLTALARLDARSSEHHAATADDIWKTRPSDDVGLSNSFTISQTGLNMHSRCVVNSWMTTYGDGQGTVHMPLWDFKRVVDQLLERKKLQAACTAPSLLELLTRHVPLSEAADPVEVSRREGLAHALADELSRRSTGHPA